MATGLATAVSPQLGYGKLAAAPFLPSDIAGLWAWYEGDQELYQSTGGAAAGVDDPVGHWGDLSGNGRHLVQATSARRPVRAVDGVYFDPENDKWMTYTEAAVDQPAVIFIVAKLDPEGGYGNPWLAGRPDGYAPMRLYSTADGPPGNYALIEVATTDGTSWPETVALDVWHVLTGVNTIPDVLVGVDGVEVSVSDLNDEIGAWGGYYLGRHELGNNCGGTVAALLVYNAALSVAERQQVRDYLNNKYGVY